MIDFSYLRPPRNLSHLKYSTRAVEVDSRTARPNRILYQNVKFDLEERQNLHKFKEYLKQKEPTKIYPDHILLKFLYMGSNHIQESSQLLRYYDAWHQSQQIMSQTLKGRKILESGVFYQYGRDPHYNPVIYFRPCRIDLAKYLEIEYFNALNYLLTVIEEHMLIGGTIETWNLVIDFEDKKISLPFELVENAVKKIALAFPCRLRHIIIVNSNKTSLQLLQQLKNRTPPHILSIEGPKLQIIKQMIELNQFIDPDERQKKYGGKMQNLYEFWPIKSTNKLHQQSTLYPLVQSETEFGSVINDERYFIEKNQVRSVCPSSCEIM